MAIRVTTLREAFAHFGAVAVNPVWAWSAQSPDQRVVVLTAWEDEFDPEAKPAIMDLYGHPNLSVWTKRLGNRDRIKKLQHARDHCNGKFHLVMVGAEDVNVSRRSIVRRAPHPLVMRLEKLCEGSGEFRAVGVE